MLRKSGDLWEAWGGDAYCECRGLIPYGSDYIAHLDGSTEIPGGWINQNYVQLGKQLADSVAGFAYSFVLTCLILFLMNLVPGLSLRVSPEEEELGLDDGQLGKFLFVPGLR